MIVSLTHFRYSIVKISGHFLCLVAADAVSRLSNELGRDCETIDTFGSSQLENIICAHPMDLSKTVSMFSAMHVVTDKGTGIVHTAPAHGVDDFQVAQQYMLSMVSFYFYYVTKTAQLLIIQMSYLLSEKHLVINCIKQKDIVYNIN